MESYVACLTLQDSRSVVGVAASLLFAPWLLCITWLPSRRYVASALISSLSPSNDRLEDSLCPTSRHYLRSDTNSRPALLQREELELILLDAADASRRSRSLALLDRGWSCTWTNVYLHPRMSHRCCDVREVC
jgi:hypothetical protein